MHLPLYEKTCQTKVLTLVSSMQITVSTYSFSYNVISKGLVKSTEIKSTDIEGVKGGVGHNLVSTNLHFDI